jgi:hypothetical protein
MQRFLTFVLCAGALTAPVAGQAQGVPGKPAAAIGATGRTARPVRGTTPAILPGTSANAFIHIQGNALDSADRALSRSVVRLRDARHGRVVETATTDQAGLFDFERVDPGSYIVELMGPGQAVLAASELLHVNAGESISVVVKLPLELKPIAGFLGHTVQQAATILSAAAASGVLASSVVGVDATPQVR